MLGASCTALRGRPLINCTEGEIKVLSHGPKGQSRNLSLCSSQGSGVGGGGCSLYSELGGEQDPLLGGTLSFLASGYGGRSEMRSVPLR